MASSPSSVLLLGMGPQSAGLIITLGFGTGGAAPTPVVDTPTGGKGDNARRRIPFKPTGLPPVRAARTVPVDVQQEAREAPEAETVQPVIGDVPKPGTAVALAPVYTLSPAEIDAEIAYWLRLRMQRDDDDLRLILMMSGTIH